MGEVELRLGQPDVLDRVRRGGGQRERERVGHADVLGREDHEPAGDEPRVLAGFEHAREPVEPRVGIRAADALDERGDDVVVLVVAVAQRPHRERGLGVLERDRRLTPASAASARRDLEARQRVAGVAFGPVRDVLERVVVDREPVAAEPARLVGERALHQRPQVFGSKGLEPEERRAAEQRRGQREVRVLGRRADEHEQPVFDVREERVLLGLVEPVHLVEEQDRPWPRSPSRFRARSTTSRTSFTPALTALIGSNALSVAPAMRRAIVVLPVPGGPHRITEERRSPSISARSGRPGASRSRWPTTSSSVWGRRRAAKGARDCSRSSAAAANRSAAIPRPYAPGPFGGATAPPGWTLDAKTVRPG